MTVRELVALLLQQPQDADVVFNDADTGWRMDPDEITVDDDGVVDLHPALNGTYDERIAAEQKAAWALDGDNS